MRFVDMDEETTAALRKLIDVDEPEPPPPPDEPKVARGTRVKLHIEGLASPMKAAANALVGRSYSVCAVPACTTRPSCISTTWSATASAS